MDEKLVFYSYEKGAAFHKAIEARKLFREIDSDYDSYIKTLQDVRDDPELSVNEDNDIATVRLWQSYLVKYGRDLDRRIDELSTDVICCRDTWRDDTRKIKAILNCLLDHRFSIRNFEEEVQEFTLNLTTRMTIVDEMCNIPVQTLNEIHATYSRAFDICILKLNSINSGRITVTNMALSVLALMVAILSLLVAALSLL